jgi:MFS transporter, AAHS family, 4-hydroxybenzoate transporter
MGGAVVNITRTIDARPVSRFQRLAIGLCLLVALIDGYDITSISYAAPAMRHELGLDAGMLGPIFSIALFGGLIGNLVCGPFGDTLGRRGLIIANTLLFGAATLATAQVSSFSGLLAVRFLAGFGCGVANVTCYALAAEYAPRRIGATTVMLVTAGYAIGAGSGGALAAYLIPAFGWRAVFYVGGSGALVIGAALIGVLPESLRFLSLRDAQSPQVARLLARIDPSIGTGAGVRFVSEEEAKSGLPVRHLFTERRALGTILLWIMFFMNLIELFFAQQWLPTVINAAGLDLSKAVSTGAMLQLGALTGALLYSRFVDRRENPYALVAGTFVCGAFFFILLAQAKSSLPLVMVSVFGIGFFVPGVQFAMNGLATMFYPTYIRATGVSWAVGIGRLGATIGPLFAGILLSFHWPVASVLEMAVIPAFCSTCAALAMSYVLSQRGREAPRMAAAK